MNELTTFTHELGEIRTLEIEGEPWFVGKDVAKALGYKNTRDTFNKHVDAEDKGVAKCDTLGGTQEMTIINESGLYSLILSSKLPTAKVFKRWVTSEVLPTIRKQGVYATPAKVEDILNDPDSFIAVLQNLKAERNKNLELQAVNSDLSVKNTIMQPKADYFDEMVDRNLLTTFRETAKVLDVKERKFIQFLLDRKYIYRGKKDKLLPSVGKGDGLFEVKETFNSKTQWGGVQTFITPKGRETFRLLVLGI